MLSKLSPSLARRRAEPAPAPLSAQDVPRDVDADSAPRQSRHLLATACALIALTLSAGMAGGLVDLPTGGRPEVAPPNGVPLPPLGADGREPGDPIDPGDTAGTAAERAQAEQSIRSAYSLARYLQRAVQDYSATTPGALGGFPSRLAFVGADEASSGPEVVSVLGVDARRLILAARAGPGTCAFLRDDRGVDRIETVTVGAASACTAASAPPFGWREILVD